MFFKISSSSSGSFIWHFVDSDDVIGWNHDGTFNVQLGGSYNPTNLEPRIQTDRWQHYAVVSTFSETRGYLNGVLAFTEPEIACCCFKNSISF